MELKQFIFVFVCLFIGYLIGYGTSIINQPIAGKFILDDKRRRGFMCLTMPDEVIGEYRTIRVRIKKGDLPDSQFKSNEDVDSQESQGL